MISAPTMPQKRARCCSAGGDPGLREDQDEDEQIVDGKRLLKGIGGQIGETGLAAKTHRHPGTEREAEADPEPAPHGRAAHRLGTSASARDRDIDDEDDDDRSPEDGPFRRSCSDHS
jgi:hypothetical protein